MNPKELLTKTLFSPYDLLKEEHGQLNCALDRIQEINTDIDTYAKYLSFDNSCKEATKEYWLTQLDARLEVYVEGLNDKFQVVLNQYDNVWDGKIESIGEKWLNSEEANMPEEEWRNSIWFLLNMNVEEEKQNLSYKEGEMVYNEKIEAWRRNKLTILDYHYYNLLTKVRDIITAHESSPRKSIDKYKIAFLLYTKIKSSGTTHAQLKKWFPILAVVLVDNLTDYASEIPSNEDEWYKLLKKDYKKHVDQYENLNVATKTLDSFIDEVRSIIETNELNLTRSISQSSVKENIGTTPGKKSSVFNTNFPNIGPEEDRIESLLKDVTDCFGDIIDEPHNREIKLFKERKKAYLS